MKNIPSLSMSEEEFIAQYSDVPETVKDLWNEQMILLKELERVCDKYHLKWFADGGTLLGAVRHRGFIPWDDDIDIQMFASDYEKLMRVAQKEFKYPFFLQNWETEDGFQPWKVKLRKSDVQGYTYFEDINGKNWNRGVFIDIFPLYYVPDNAGKRWIQLSLLKAIRAAFHGYEYLRTGKEAADSAVLWVLFVSLYLAIHWFCDYKKLSMLYLKIASWQKKPTDKIAVTAFAPGEKNLVWDTKWFKSTIDIPFMGRTVPAPCSWDERLKRQYGEYMIPKKNASRHGGMKVKLSDQSEDAEWLKHE